MGNQLCCAGARAGQMEKFEMDHTTPLSIIIFGATGDLAKKKLYPALYQLMFGCPDAPLIPRDANIVGYGRSVMERDAFLEKQCVNVTGGERDAFLQRCSYFSGAYDKVESYAALDKHLRSLEGECVANRIFFFSVPSTVFADATRCVKENACAPSGGYTRLILEKPFGRDSESFAELNDATSSLFSEDQLFRIDHYLGKEVVLNLVTLRFGNQMFEPLWNKDHIASVQIVFKEDLGTGGRGGYFDGFGIIRDIMQNHLLQVFMWLAMEPPESLTREAIQNSKLKLLRSVQRLTMDDCFLGQFGKGFWDINGIQHEEPGYLDDSTVPAGSRCPTYAAVVLKVDDPRWQGVPFLMRAGKGLDERLAEVRVTFKEKPFNALVPGSSNELVMRIQPDEAVYVKCMSKVPGWQQRDTKQVVLDMSYKTSFGESYVADAYERMFLNTALGDGSLFVGSEELVEAWRIFTPLLDQIDKEQPQPVIYPFGVRVPDGMDEFAKRYGVTMSQNWHEYLAECPMEGLKEMFDNLSANGKLSGAELKTLFAKFYDGREPTDAQVAKIMKRLDRDNDGLLTFDEIKLGMQKIRMKAVSASSSTEDFSLPSNMSFDRETN
eukprot:TRINITY_DN45720_c0_g1_i1.p1 TRINITY_DN45720_c0_g1~~TRINITY_DN45720_c0_g1_i1.p1  ORF type:complete len:607 (+),score=75.70 TRINITY_DN45720_c0_g1_i1:50-1870(+)